MNVVNKKQNIVWLEFKNMAIEISIIYLLTES